MNNEFQSARVSEWVSEPGIIFWSIGAETEGIGLLWKLLLKRMGRAMTDHFIQYNVVAKNWKLTIMHHNGSLQDSKKIETTIWIHQWQLYCIDPSPCYYEVASRDTPLN